MLEMSWITAILQSYSQEAGLFGNVIVKRIKIRLFDLLARFHYILNLSRIYVRGEKMLNTFCPGRGSNQVLLRGSQTLYRVAIKAGLYRKAVQVYIITNITTYSPSILDSSPNLN